jgi:hypothetical protein
MRAAARITIPALGTRTLCPSVCVVENAIAPDGGAEAEVLRHLEPPFCPLQRARRAQHAVCGIIDEHHRIAGFERGVFHLLFALLELATEVSCKMLPNYRVTENARTAAEIALLPRI